MGAGSVAEAVDAFTAHNDPPLYIVTVGSADHGDSGCLAGFVTQCSIGPPRFLVCLSKLNHTFFASEGATSMAIHLLGEDQTDLAVLFGERTGDDYDKFAHCSWDRKGSGAPVLRDCAAWLDGSMLDRFSVGDHEAILMSPTGGGAGPHGRPAHAAERPQLHPGHPGTP